MSDEPQRSLSGYKSAVHEQEDFENPNEGKPLLNDTDEYVLRLTKIPRVIKSTVTKKKKDGSEVQVKVDKAVCEFEEKNTGNIVVSFFRIDSLNFAQTQEEEQFESGVIRFFKKIKQPLVEGVSPDWDKYFVAGMRFRGRAVVKTKTDKDGNTVATYFLDIPTCRPLLASDKAGEDFDKEPPTVVPPKEPPTKPLPDASNLQNALFIVKGCKDSIEALQRLATAPGIATDVIQAFLVADKNKAVEYPIK